MRKTEQLAKTRTNPPTAADVPLELRAHSGTIVIFSDTWCAFAHVAVYRLHEARQRLGLVGRVSFDHRAFPMELLNGRPGSRPGSDSEVPSVGACEPEAGWQLWQDNDWLYPNSTLPALEAVQAAKFQSMAASEALDLALRRAFWMQSRCITNLQVICDVAAQTPGVDAPLIKRALLLGAAREAVRNKPSKLPQIRWSVARTHFSQMAAASPIRG